MKRRDPSQHRRRPLIDPDVGIGRVRWSSEFVGSSSATAADPHASASSAAIDSSSSSFFDVDDHRDHRRHRLGAANSTSRDLLTEFGAFSSLAPSTSPVFGYSQKNFHISDGNLYSVLSPFQARRSSARPSFLRGQSCVTSVNDSNNQSSSSSSSMQSHHHVHHHQRQSNFSSSKNLQDSAHSVLSTSPGSSARLSKPKFHHQEASTSQHQPYVASHRSHHGSTAASQSMTSQPVEESSSSRPASTTWFDNESLFARRKKPQMSMSMMEGDDCDYVDDVMVMESTYPKKDRRRLFRRSDESSTSSWDRSDEFSRKSFRSGDDDRQDRLWPFNDDDDDDGDDVIIVDNVERLPLNLCIADRQRLQMTSSTSSSSIRKNIGERIRRKSELSERSKFSLSSLFDDFSMRSSKFRTGDPVLEGHKTTTTTPFDKNDGVDLKEEDVLDLSMKRKSAQGPRPTHQPQPQQPQQQQCREQNSGEVADKKPHISEMFENMQIKDDDYMQDAVKRYNETRQLLMQTHPEMFGGHDWNYRQQYLPYANIKPPPPPPSFKSHVQDDHDHHQVLSTAASRPRSWASEPAGSKLPDLRPQSAEHEQSFLAPPTCAMSQPTSCSSHVPPLLIPSASFSLVQQTLFQQQQEQQYQQMMTMEQSSTRRSASAPSIAAAASTSSLTSAGGKSSSSRGTRHHLDVKSKPFGSITEMPKGSKSPRPRKSISVSPSSSQQHVNDISICKFKLIKGANPVLEEKKSFFVPVIRSSSEDSTSGLRTSGLPPPPLTTTDICSTNSSSLFFLPSPPTMTSLKTTSGSIGDKFRALKFHVGSQEETGLRLQQQGGGIGVSGGVAVTKRLRRRSRKAIAREKLEATFREQGFLIKTQQVSSAEGAVYCKFRQLRKFTRYLFKSWKDYLPKDLDDMSKVTASSPSSTPVAVQMMAQHHNPHDHPGSTAATSGANRQ